jgi:hypothetical protein
MKKYERIGYVNIFREHDDPASNKPIMRGSLTLEDLKNVDHGQPLRISLWKKTSEKTGKAFLSGSIEVVIEDVDEQTESGSSDPKRFSTDDDLPF